MSEIPIKEIIVHRLQHTDFICKKYANRMASEIPEGVPEFADSINFDKSVEKFIKEKSSILEGINETQKALQEELKKKNKAQGRAKITNILHITMLLSVFVGSLYGIDAIVTSSKYNQLKKHFPIDRNFNIIDKKPQKVLDPCDPDRSGILTYCTICENCYLSDQEFCPRCN